VQVRTRHRRFAAFVAGTVLTLTVVLGLSVVAVSAASHAPTLRAIRFPASFVPQQITAAAGSLWVLGSPSPSTFTDCTLRKLDPSTIETQSFALPQCASDITSGDGQVYLLINLVEPSTNTRDYHVEVFDPTTGVTQVLPPVVLQNIGSAVAHTDLVFGDGSLWLYGYALGGKTEVVQISPVTGGVESMIGNPPEIGGIFPAVVADGPGVWLGGGAGGSAQLEWVHAGAGATTNISLVSGGRTGSILWLSDAGGRVWAGVAKYAGAPGTTTVTTRLVALTENGTLAVRSPTEAIGAYPMVATPDGRLWDVAYAKCGAPEHLLEISPTSGVSRAVASLAAGPSACYNQTDGSDLAVVGRYVFALFPTGGALASPVLYRAAT
jgi:hypothetical protein